LQPENGHIGVTFGTAISHVPSDPHYLVLLGWLSPTALGEYLTGRPNEREVEVVMDCHIRQYVALGDVVETAAGISAGEDIISRSIPPVEPVQPPAMKRSK